MIIPVRILVMLQGNNRFLMDLNLYDKKPAGKINGVQMNSNIRAYRNIECNSVMTGYVKILSG